MSAIDAVKALVFDVFGTVVDWRGSIIREGQQLNQQRGWSVDWAAFADDWRGQYQPSMDLVRRGELPWTILDTLHRRSLDQLLPKYGLTGLTEAETDHLNRVWHRLDPWPDSVAGLWALKRRFVIATLSNGNTALLTNMAKRAGLPWDCILSAETAQAYKPDPRAYQAAADRLGLAPNQVMLVAAHQSDLRAASRVGLRTAFVARPLEFGPDRRPDLTPDPDFDLAALDFNHLARQLNA